MEVLENCWIDAPAEHPYNTTVGQSLADSDLVAPWVSGGSGVTEMAGNAPSEVVEEGSADAKIVPAVPAETAESLDEDSFSLVPAESVTSGLGSAEAESSATSTGAVTPAHDAEDPHPT
ncbi:hypothetical protein PHMEG_00034511 [Phytophthora megakarya]|uniref:Uncharacterized protein n=1 Tax=Phytophthora megakarya TaxID=4795 RepID=A0A225UQU6_9STRA|nr:hypothetical protein PHMEG_00034511 [Phytophthora megakarya]